MYISFKENELFRIDLGKFFPSHFFKGENYLMASEKSELGFINNFIFDIRLILTLFLLSLQKDHVLFFDKFFIKKDKTFAVRLYIKNKIKNFLFYLNSYYFIFYLIILTIFRKYEA